MAFAIEYSICISEMSPLVIESIRGNLWPSGEESCLFTVLCQRKAKSIDLSVFTATCSIIGCISPQGRWEAHGSGPVIY